MTSGATMGQVQGGPPPSPFLANSAAERKRQPSFLVKYPRKLKIAVAVLCMGLVIVSGVAVLDDLMDNAARKRMLLQVAADNKKKAEKTLAEAAAEAALIASKTLDLRAADKVPPVQINDRMAVAILQNDTDDRSARLIVAPDDSLTERTNDGELPRIGNDGRMPWQVYARPFNPEDKRPRVAIVMADLGLSNVATLTAVDRLPSQVTLAFDSQSPVVGSWLARARQLGHETLLAVPMEPADYPRSDPGPDALLTNLSDANNLDRLRRAMRTGSGYVGVTSFTGVRFLTDGSKLSAFMGALKKRGLLVYDPRLTPQSLAADAAREKLVPVAAAFKKIDEIPTAEAIDAALADLEKAARLTGHAVATASPLPLTVERIEAWAKILPSHSIALAPLSAVVE